MQHPELRRWLLLSLSATSLLFAACAGHQGTPPSTDIDEIGLRDHIRVLASDEYAGRRPGTEGEQKTTTYLVEQLRKLGLKPGNGESYLQTVPLTEVTPQGMPSLSFSSATSGKALTYNKDMVLWSPLDEPQVEVHGSEVIFVGYGIVAPQYRWDDYADVDVRGKTVLVMLGDPGYGSKDPQVFKGVSMTYYARWSYKFEEAARHGASAVLLIHDAGAANFGWNAVQASWTAPQFVGTDSAAAPRTPIQGWLSGDSARAVLAQGALDAAAVMGAAARPGFKAVAVKLKADFSVHHLVRHLTSTNVLAVLPGAKHKLEAVMVTAHWDGLGRQEPSQGAAVYSSALDDAAGVAGALELAQSFSRTQPAADRSIVFALFTAGQWGSLGSAYYVEHPTFALRDTVGVINLDLPHIGGPSRDVMILGYGNSDIEDYLRAAAVLKGREVHPDPTPERGFFFSTDSFSFARYGVPVLYAKGGIDDSARGPVFGQAQIDEYMTHRYHQATDKYSPDWDVRGMLDDLELFYEVGNRMARSRHFPHWYPNSDFRGGRGGSEPPKPK